MTKSLTDLTTDTSLASADLFLVRDTTNNVDKAATLATVASSIPAGSLTNSMLSTTAGELGGAWTTYTATLAGWSGTPTQLCRSAQIGKTVHVRISVTGTSNATTATVSLPVMPSANCSLAVPYNAETSADNIGLCNISPSSLTAVFFGGTSGVYSAWPSTGTKNIHNFSCTYEAA